MKHVALLSCRKSTCLINIVICKWILHCVIDSLVTYRQPNTKIASSRLGQYRGPFALPENCLQCICTYIFNRFIFVFVSIHHQIVVGVLVHYIFFV